MQQSRAPRRLFDDIVAQLQSRQTEQAIASCQRTARTLSR